MVRYLVINNPVCLRGTTGSVLKVVGGPIILNIKGDHSDGNVKVSELKIIFEEKTSSPKSENYSYLFKLNNGSMLELTDCHLSSINASNSKKHICFQLNTFKSNTLPNNISILTVVSTNITNFYQVVRSGENSVISIEKSYISGTFGKSIVVLNPLIFKLYESTLENNQDNSIHIKMIKNDKNKGVNRRILVEKNEIKYNFGSGIYIEGSDYIAGSNLEIVLQGNTIKKNGLTGIFLCDLFVSKIFIEKNKFIQNKGNGINFQKVLSKSVLDQSSTEVSKTSAILESVDRSVAVSENIFMEMETYGAFVNDSYVYFYGNNFVSNKLSGLIFCNINYNEMSRNFSSAVSESFNQSKAAKENSFNKVVVVEKCMFKKNGGNGFKLVNFNFPVLTLNSKFVENCEFGLHLEVEEHWNKERHKSADSIMLSDFNFVLQDSEVLNNMKSGVKIIRMSTLIDKCLVKGNLDYAINIPNAEFKKCLKINKTRGRTSTVEGLIGGDWGQIVVGTVFECNMCCTSLKSTKEKDSGIMSDIKTKSKSDDKGCQVF